MYELDFGKTIEVPEILVAAAAAEAGSANGLTPDARCYRHDAVYDSAPVELIEIDNIFADWHPAVRMRDYDNIRLTRVLVGIMTGGTLPPVKVEARAGVRPYALLDGYHRVIASKLCGFHCIPCIGAGAKAVSALTSGKRPGAYVPPHLRKTKGAGSI